jgi:hypothetical protein
MVPRVAHDQLALVYEHPGGQVHPALRAAPAGRAPLGRPVGLAEHDVGRLLVVVRVAVPDQHPVVAGVGRDHVVVVEEHPARGVHPRHRRVGRR